MDQGIWKYRCGAQTRCSWMEMVEESFMGMDFRVLSFEGIIGNIRLEELAKGKRVDGKTARWETLESGCGKETKWRRSRRTRAGLCPGTCGRGGFSQERSNQHGYARKLPVAR